MNYDIPDLPKPAKVVMYQDSMEVVFPLPYPADGPNVDLLKRHPLVVLAAKPKPEIEKPFKPSRKEV